MAGVRGEAWVLSLPVVEFQSHKGYPLIFNNHSCSCVAVGKHVGPWNLFEKDYIYFYPYWENYTLGIIGSMYTFCQFIVIGP